jgi:hypothetical protein
MLGDIFEKSEHKEVAATYYSRILRDYPLSPMAANAKAKLVAFGVPVPQPNPKALAWMQAEQSAPRPKQSILSKPLSIVHPGPGKELVVAARTGTPTLQPEPDTTSATDILTGGGGQARIGGAGGANATGNTAVVEVATPGSGATGGSSVETPANDSQPPSTPDANSAAPSDTTANPEAPAASSTPGATDSAQPANGQGTAKPGADAKDKKESSSKKKKGLKKIIPW